MVQYDIAKHQLRAIAFLGKVIEKRTKHIVGSVFGLKMSADGLKLYAFTNGCSYKGVRPAEGELAKVGWSFVSFLEIHIRASEW